MKKEITTTTTSVAIDPRLKTLLSSEERPITIVHCAYGSDQFVSGARIWPQTCLVEENGQTRKLLQAYGIDLYPTWTRYRRRGPVHFTLVFEGLSRDCSRFHLLEKIPEPSGFISGTIWRNKTDVYQAELIVQP